MKLLLFFILIFSDLLATKGLINKTVYDTSDRKVITYSHSYALLVGVSKYKYWDDLPAIPEELKNIKKALENNGFTVLPIVKNPNSDELESKYTGFMKKYGKDENNRLLVYFSGHGDTQQGLGLLVPSDATLKPDDIVFKSLSMDTIKAKAKKMKAKHVLFLFDSCFSGSIFTTKGKSSLPSYIEKSIKNPVRYFITAGDETQMTPANSVFANSFVEAIANAKADRNKDGYITGRELGLYLYEQVSEQTKDGLKNSPQFGPLNIPRFSKGDFVFFTPRSKGAEKSSFIFKEILQKRYSLTISTTPSDAVVEFTDLKINYYDGIKLKKGKYNIKISKKGYITQKGSVELKSNADKTVILTKEQITAAQMPKVDGEVWIDKETDLTWQVKIDKQEYNYADAQNYCQNLSVAGYKDWRVPNINELKSILTTTSHKNSKIHSGKTYIKKPLLDSMVMENQWFWSDTKINSSFAWIVHFYYGYDYNGLLSNKYYVRCVR